MLLEEDDDAIGTDWSWLSLVVCTISIFPDSEVRLFRDWPPMPEGNSLPPTRGPPLHIVRKIPDVIHEKMVDGNRKNWIYTHTEVVFGETFKLERLTVNIYPGFTGSHSGFGMHMGFLKLGLRAWLNLFREKYDSGRSRLKELYPILGQILS
jgi:hypothetical protein